MQISSILYVEFVKRKYFDTFKLYTTRIKYSDDDQYLEVALTGVLYI